MATGIYEMGCCGGSCGRCGSLPLGGVGDVYGRDPTASWKPAYRVSWPLTRSVLGLGEVGGGCLPDSQVLPWGTWVDVTYRKYRPIAGWRDEVIYDQPVEAIANLSQGIAHRGRFLSRTSGGVFGAGPAAALMARQPGGISVGQLKGFLNSGWGVGARVADVCVRVSRAPGLGGLGASLGEAEATGGSDFLAMITRWAIPIAIIAGGVYLGSKLAKVANRKRNARRRRRNAPYRVSFMKDYPTLAPARSLYGTLPGAGYASVIDLGSKGTGTRKGGLVRRGGKVFKRKAAKTHYSTKLVSSRGTP